MTLISGQPLIPDTGSGARRASATVKGGRMGKDEVRQRMNWVVKRAKQRNPGTKSVKWSELVAEVPEFAADPPPWGGPAGKPEVIVTDQGTFAVVDDTDN